MDLSTPQACIEALRRIGYDTILSGLGEWRVRKPSGVAVYARSEEVLRELAADCLREHDHSLQLSKLAKGA